jgi:mRNA interferase MazF
MVRPGRRGGRGAFPRRGEVYLVSFDPAQGSEIQKTRPALILQNDVGNRFSPVTIVAAITSSVGGRSYPTEVRIRAGEGGLEVDSVVLLSQIRSIDRRRLLRKLGTMSRGTMGRVDRALIISLGLGKFGSTPCEPG